MPIHNTVRDLETIPAQGTVEVLTVNLLSDVRTHAPYRRSEEEFG